MKISGIFPGFNISAKGMSIQRKKMDLIAENIANADDVRDVNGMPYKRKYLNVKEIGKSSGSDINSNENNTLKLNTTEAGHISNPSANIQPDPNSPNRTEMKEMVDNTQGDVVYEPNNPYADDHGYVQMSNVNIITEMTNMISATRNYEANLTALNSSKQMAKDSLDI